MSKGYGISTLEKVVYDAQAGFSSQPSSEAELTLPTAPSPTTTPKGLPPSASVTGPQGGATNI